MKEAGISDDEAEEAIQELIQNSELISINESELSVESSSLVMDQTTWLTMVERIRKILADYHLANPLQIGMPIEELRSKMGMETKLATFLLERAAKDGTVVIVRGYVALIDHRVQLEENEKKVVDQLLLKFDSNPYAPPSLKESKQEIGDDLVRFLLESRALVQVSEDVVFKADKYDEMVDMVKEDLQGNGTLTVADVRDKFDTSRKYALALMEHLDAVGVTVREGDLRRLV